MSKSRRSLAGQQLPVETVLETVGTPLLANIALPSPYPPIQRKHNRDSYNDTSDSDYDDDQAQAVTALESNQPGTIASKAFSRFNHRRENESLGSPCQNG